MSFAHPGLLIGAALGAVGLAVLYAALVRRRTRLDLVYSDLSFLSAALRPRRWIGVTLTAMWLASFALLALAAGGPSVALPVPVRDGDVFICIDTSGSMATSDVAPNRAQAAVAAARAFVAQSPPGVKIGIIGFATDAQIVSPLTADHAAANAALDQLPLPNGGTAIGDALQLAASALPSRGHRVIVLVTDGVNNAGSDPVEVARWLGAHHIPVYTIGIGTATGGLIPGTFQEATIDEPALRKYAALSGGAYARVTNASQLRAALAHLGRVTALEFKKTDAGTLFALGGGVVAIAAFFLGFGIGRYP